MTKIRVLSLLAAAVVFVAVEPAQSQVSTAKVTGGEVQGAVAGNVASFKGIPFASPPVGELRWKAPQPIKAWSGVKKVDAFAPGCMQDARLATMLGGPQNFSEDCLYLNVWTGAKSKTEKLPVMVWIYGGGFALGATNTPLYDGTKFAQKGVVLVSTAYRVGPFGFLAHPELSRESGKGSGVYGLQDMIAALRWVKENIAQFGGDYESIKQVQQVTPSSVRLSYRADNVPNPLEGLQKLTGDKAPKASESVSGQRTVRAQDLQTAHDYMQWFGPNEPEVIPGTTAISISREVLAELKGKGQTQFSFRVGGLKGMAGSWLGALGQMAGGGAPGAPKETKDLADMGKAECALKRVGDGLTSFPVLLNNQRVSLPAVHAQCSTDDGLADFYFLDDLDNPLALAWKLAGSDTLQLVKISYPQQPPPVAQNSGSSSAPAGSGAGGQQIEQELKQRGQAEVYGIYFDFASDKIKPESEPVLREIADALNHNPAWKLRVEGHTDNIGGDDYNTNLSQRRAEAVKLALVSRYHIAADRLTPQGFGATRPKEPNDTLAGRARNRRVELGRE